MSEKYPANQPKQQTQLPPQPDSTTSPAKSHMTSRERKYVGRYSKLTQSQLDDRIRKLNRLLSPCEVCPRHCMALRDCPSSSPTLRPTPTPHGSPTPGASCHGLGQSMLMVSSINLHHGEEPPISGTRGSGTVFLTGCNLRCIFCQNFPISQSGNGKPITTAALADRLLELQTRGAHNINFVSPTHYTPQIVESIAIAAHKGLSIPIVWNSNGFESVETLRLLEGIVDIYLPDFKYWDETIGKELSGIADYPRHAAAAISEMYRQVGSLICDDAGIGIRGIIVRHLILPADLDGAEEVLGHLAANLGRELHISLMSQYFPAHKAHLHPPMDRRITADEYERASQILDTLNLENGWVQDPPDDDDDSDETEGMNQADTI